MPEALALVLDSSQYMRNGNLSPSRLNQQRTAVEYIVRGKIHSNVENVCSITAACNTPILLCPMTHEERHLINAIQQCKEGDGFDLMKGIMQAHLAIKHRPKRQQTPTIMCFIGSPFVRGTPETTEKGLKAIANVLRKESIGLMFILFGENISPEHMGILQKTIDAADKNGNSRIIQHIVSDPYQQLVDTIRRTGVLTGDEDGLTGDEDPEILDALRQIAAAEGRAFDGPINTAADEIDDPELAEAIRLSLLDMEAMGNNHPQNEENKDVKSEKDNPQPRVEEPPGDTVISAENEEMEANIINTTGQIDFESSEIKKMLSAYNINMDKKEDGEKDKKDKKDDGNDKENNDEKADEKKD